MHVCAAQCVFKKGGVKMKQMRVEVAQRWNRHHLGCITLHREGQRFKC